MSYFRCPQAKEPTADVFLTFQLDPPDCLRTLSVALMSLSDREIQKIVLINRHCGLKQSCHIKLL